MDVKSQPIRLGHFLQTCAALSLLLTTSSAIISNQSRPLQLSEPRQLISAEPQSADDPCRRLNIIDRRNWSAKSPMAPLDSFASRPQRVIIHQAWDGRTCADLDSCTVRLRAIQAYHQYSKLWPDISYNFLISGDGTIFEGVGFTKMGFHTLNYNHDSLGIALIGTFQDVYPTPAMERSLAALLDCALRSGRLTPQYQLHGHRDARCTICPGEAAYRRLATMARFRPGPLPRYSCPAGLPTAGLMSSAARQEPRNVTSMGEADARDDDDDDGRLDINLHNQLILAATSGAGKRETGVGRKEQLRPTEVIEEAAFVGVLTRRRLTTGLALAQQQPAQSERQVVTTTTSQPIKKAQKTTTSAPSTTESTGKQRFVLINLQQLGQSSASQTPSLGGATSALFYVLRPQPTSAASSTNKRQQSAQLRRPSGTGFGSLPGSTGGTGFTTGSSTSPTEPDDASEEEATTPESGQDQQLEESVEVKAPTLGKAPAKMEQQRTRAPDGAGQQVAPSGSGMLAVLERLLEKMSFFNNITLF